jgi:hypothetical protein
MDLTEDQCQSFNAFQLEGMFHPFTCGNDHGGDRDLIAESNGLHCPNCDYHQDWAHSWMLDWSWKHTVDNCKL